MLKYFLGILGLSTHLFVFSETSQIDSLKSIISKQDNDTNKVNQLVEVSWDLINAGKYDTALILAREAKGIATALKYKTGVGDALNNTGVVYWMQGKYDMALENFFGALQIRKESAHQKGMAQCYNNIGGVYFNMGRYTESLKYNFASLKISEALDRKRGIASSYTNIAAIYEAQGNNTDALKNYLLSLNISKQIGDKVGTAKAYMGMGNVHYNQGKYPEALKDHFNSLTIFTETKYMEGTADAYNNIGNVYSRQAAIEKDPVKQKALYGQSLQNYFSSLKLREELGDQEGIATSLANIGATYEDLGKHKEAESYSIKALKLAQEINAPERIKEAYENLAKIYSATGRTKEALASFKAFIAVRDSLVNEENTKKAMHLEMQYTFDKKEIALKKEQEKRESMQKAELRRHRQINWFVGGGTFLILIVIALMFNRYQLTQKNKFQEETNRQQKKQAIAVMDAQEEERKRIAEDLHDSLGHMLSTIKLNLQMVPEKQSQVTNSLQLVDQASEEIRSITFNLMPRTLEEEGLIPALNELAAKVTGSGSVRVALHIHDMEKFILEKQSQFNIYRIIQEAVNNILKHADAKEISIQLIGQNDHMTIMIEDDGKGFDIATNKSGRGLKNIVTRSVWLKGVINIDSTPGRGTTITTEIPL